MTQREYVVFRVEAEGPGEGVAFHLFNGRPMKRSWTAVSQVNVMLRHR